MNQPVDRVIQLMRDLEDALGDSLEGPGLLLGEIERHDLVQDLAWNRGRLEALVAAIRGKDDHAVS